MFLPDPKKITLRKKAKNKPFPMPELIGRLDTAYSRWLRISESKDFKCQCFTCDTWDHWEAMDCGHFIPRRHKHTRWMYMNTRPQCKDCNQGKAGNLIVFEARLKQRYGDLTIEKMKSESRQIVKLARAELLEKIITYKTLFKSVA